MSRSLKAIDSDHSKAVPEDEKLKEVISTLMVAALLEKTPIWEKVTSLGGWTLRKKTQISQAKEQNLAPKCKEQVS